MVGDTQLCYTRERSLTHTVHNFYQWPDMTRSTGHIFGDAHKGFSEIDNAELQADLQWVVEWYEKWQLQLNHNRCKVLHLGRNNRREIYKVGDTELQCTVLEKVSMLTISWNSADTYHLFMNKASKLLWITNRTFSCLDEDTMRCCINH